MSWTITTTASACLSAGSTADWGATRSWGEGVTIICSAATATNRGRISLANTSPLARPPASSAARGATSATAATATTYRRRHGAGHADRRFRRRHLHRRGGLSRSMPPVAPPTATRHRVCRRRHRHGARAREPHLAHRPRSSSCRLRSGRDGGAEPHRLVTANAITGNAGKTSSPALPATTPCSALPATTS